MRGAELSRALALAAALALLLISGCGGGDDSTTTTESPSPTVEQAPPPAAHTAAGGATKAPAHDKRPQGLKPTDTKSLPNEGTAAVAPGVPTTQGGDNSIQTFGLESDGGERAAAAGVLKTYLAALLNQEWAKGCSLLAVETREDVEHLWVQAAGPNRGPACEKAMAGFLHGVPKNQIRILGDLHVLSMRIEGDRGFLIYDSSNGTPSESPMQNEDGHWKVRTLIAKELLLTPEPNE